MAPPIAKNPTTNEADDMRTITPAELETTLQLHAKWANGEDGGVRGDLSECDLRGVDLSGRDLRGINLSGADLRKANLRGADLGRPSLNSR